MGATVRGLYQALLHNQTLGEQMQERIYDFATRTADYDVLAQLARHPSLTADLDARLGALTSAKVLAAWLTRPGRDLTTALDKLRREERVTVQSAVAGLDGLGDALYGEMVERYDRPAPLLPLMENPSVSPTVRTRAAERLAPRSHRLGRRDARRFRVVVQANSETHDIVGLLAPDPGIVETVAPSPELSEATLDRLTKAVHNGLIKAADAATRDSRSGNAEYVWLRLIRVLATNPGLGSARAELIARAVEEARSRVRTQHPNAYLGAYDATLVELRAITPSPGAPVTLAEAKTVSDPETLKAAVDWEQSQTSPMLALALAQNPHLDADSLSAVLGRVTWDQCRLLVEQNLDRPDRLGAILVKAPYLCTDAVLTKSADPTETVMWIIRACVDAGKPLPDAVVSSRYVTVDVIRTLPAGYFSADTPEPLRAALESLLVDTFGDDDLCWVSFESLWASFRGSVGELLTIVQATHAPASGA